MVVPSWLLSLFFHATVLLLASQLAGRTPIRPDIEGNGGDGFREVGIYTGEPAGGSGNLGTGDALPAGNPAMTNAASAPAPSAQAPDVPATAPFQIPLPDVLTEGPAVIGPGTNAAPPEIASTLGNSLLRPGSGGLTSGGGGGGPGGTGRPGMGTGTGDGIGSGRGGTTFIGARDEGRRFVYVIDSSGSMADFDALLAAKSELMTSLERLTEKQQFQVIFYNTKLRILVTRDQRFPMFYGTDAQRLQVAEQLRSIEPMDGTLHFPALAEALKFHPDVIFFLTDGADPAMSARDLEEIRIRNKEGVHIHCIEFGEGPASKVNRAGNFLVKLSEQHNGQYIYRDVTQFRRKGG